MRDYAKVAPQFWTGKTGKALRAKGQEAVIVGLYLMTSPHANMLGLYYVPILFIAHETGLGLQGATKGLAWACEAGFCSYDRASEMVWVYEMASYQIADSLKPTDNRVAGIQKDYDALSSNPFLEGFYERYAPVFHLSSRRDNAIEADLVTGLKPSPSKAPSKPGAGAGAGEGSGNDDVGPGQPFEYPADFEEAWREYPARPGANKRDTFKAWSARLNAKDESRAASEEMLDGTRRYAAFVLAMRTEPQFIKQPTTFFGKSCHFRDPWKVPARRGSLDGQDYTVGVDGDGRLL
jgi:hypothetical protein